MLESELDMALRVLCGQGEALMRKHGIVLRDKMANQPAKLRRLRDRKNMRRSGFQARNGRGEVTE